MSFQNRTIITFGSGPGIGNSVAGQFAAKGFNHIILFARNEKRLEEDRAFVQSKNKNAKVDTTKLDLSDISAVKDTLKKLEASGEDIEVVFFNAARIAFKDPLTVPTEELEEDFRVTNVALVAVAQWAIPHFQALAKSNKSARPSFLVTNSFLPVNPAPQLLSLSAVKASQKNIVHNLDKGFSQTGVHFGLISVGGIVARENKVLNPTNIAEKTWEFFDLGTGLEVSLAEG